MIYAEVNDKGGVGKSLTSIVLACLLHAQNRKFKIVELDNSNNSLVFKNSDFLTEDKAISVKLDQKDNVISDMLFDIMSDPNLDYIVDVGGGDDTRKVLDILKPIELPKTYLIPTLKIKKYLQNALNTYNYIDDPSNTFFVLNQYSDIKNIKQEFRYFFGDADMGIEPVSKVFKKSQAIYMPYSDLFQIAEDDEQTILDLASISQGVSEAEARKMSFELAAGDRAKFGVLITQYNNSIKAQKLFTEIQKNAEALF
ncbi:MAG: hypothetical protein U9N59_03720 [Campylobacterota bacterium]|nr:hypothetical protein [Campylobacterota bacterium]